MNRLGVAYDTRHEFIAPRRRKKKEIINFVRKKKRRMYVIGELTEINETYFKISFSHEV